MEFSTSLMEDNFYTQLIDAMPDGVVGIDENGKIVLFNQQAIAMFGYEKAEVLGKGLEMLMPQQLKAHHEELVSQYFAVPKNRLMGHSGKEMFGKRKNGVIFPVDISLNYVNTPQGSIALSSIRDISERKKIETALRNSEQKLIEAQRIAHIGSWELDLRTNLTTWSEEQFLMNGVPYSPEPVAQDLFISLLHPEDRGWMLNKMQEAFEHGRNDSVYRIIHPNGAVRYLHGIAEVVYDKDGVPIKMFGTNQDITDRKNAEETLQHQNKELKKTNEELDRFVYSASHDLRAPLTSLLGLIGIVEMEAESDNVLQERLDMMKRTVHRLDSFIADILDYSRNSRTGINYEPICFETKIKEIEELAKHLNDGTHKCKLVVELDLQSTFYSDRRRIWMLLNNLVSNAINYSDLEKESCYCKISIKTNEQEAVIKIEDNGKGIAAKDIERIFEMFYRASGKSRGSGLGLYIVKETVEKLNGTISVTSIPAPDEKSGTQFLITLPNNKPKE